MGVFGKIGNWRRKIGLWVVLPAVAVVALYNGVQDIGPSWQARQGGGVVGTFTATHEECGRRSCTMHGTFTATDGSRTRRDLVLRDSGDALRVGDTAPAVDTGDDDTVFPPGGGNGVALSIGFIVVGTIVLAGWVFFLVRAVRRRSAAAPAAAAVPGPVGSA